MTRMKETIQSISIDLFYQKGYFATSISDIARGCGIQKASIYYHFSSKEELLFQIMSHTMSDLVSLLKESLVQADPIDQRMRVAVRTHVQFHLHRQKENFIANSELRGLSEEHYRSIVALRDEYESIFQALIREGRDNGAFVAVDVRILSYAILNLCTSGAFWYNPGGRLAVEDIAAIYENFIIAGLQNGTLRPPV